MSVSGGGTRTSHAVKRVLFHELIVIDNNYKEFLFKFVRLPLAWFTALLSSNATARSPLSVLSKAQAVPFDTKVVAREPGVRDRRDRRQRRVARRRDLRVAGAGGRRAGGARAHQSRGDAGPPRHPRRRSEDRGMSDPIGTYTFLPWIRQGIANRIGGTVAGSGRATIDVTLAIDGAKKGGGSLPGSVSKPVELYGPGDVIGVDRAQISRMEPPHWTTNFEPNYLASIEFYDEDFPWRYTPAAPLGKRLLPWLALVVLEEQGEFKEGAGIASRPLPFIEVTAGFADVFPPAGEGWAWAHAHFNAAFSANVVENDADLAASKAAAVIASAPDTACARMLCPRRLKPETGYHAFLMPAFESGRLAGLGIDPGASFAVPANALSPTSSAWADYGVPANRPDATLFPFYHRWYFRTAEQGDFESLVRLLRPRVVDPRVGNRDMDVTDPAPNVTGITDPDLGRRASARRGAARAGRHATARQARRL
ncbi:MAG: hypothetical protein WDN44_07455 [Sphingomonas sp.]